MFTGRPTVTTTVVDGDGTTRTTTSSPWTPEDQALMMAWREYRDSLHDRCGQPIARSTHPYMEGWYDVEDLICYACTALEPAGEDGQHKPFMIPVVVDTRDHDADPLQPIPDGAFVARDDASEVPYDQEN